MECLAGKGGDIFFGLLRQLGRQYGWLGRKNQVALWAVATMAISTVLALRVAAPLARRHEAWVAANSARQAVARGDMEAAEKDFHRAVEAGRDDPRLWSEYAAFLKSIHSPEQLSVLEKLAMLKPEDASIRIRWAAAALQAGEAALACRLLDGVPAACRRQTDYLEAAGDLAMWRGDFDAASAFYRQVLARHPLSALEFRMAEAEARSTKENLRLEGFARLRKLANRSSRDALAVLRVEIDLAVSDGDLAKARRLASRLTKDDAATPADWLKRLELDSSKATFEEMKQRAEREPSQIEWMVGGFLRDGLAAETAEWFKQMPDRILSTPECRSCLIPVALANGDWETALRHFEDAGRLSPSLAALARQAFGEVESGNENADTTWARTLQLAGSDAAARGTLCMLAESKGWQGASERALRSLSEAAPDNVDVLRRIARLEWQTGNLVAFREALAALKERDESSLWVRKHWILVNSLLPYEAPKELAHYAHDTMELAGPSAYATQIACALALLRAGDAAAAGALLGKTPPSAWTQPENALYAGAVLAANGKSNAALKCLSRAAIQFPEELGFRRTWEDRARGRQSPEEEKGLLLAGAVRVPTEEADALRVRLQAQRERWRRSDLAQQIYQNLKTQAAERMKTPEALRQLLNSVRAPFEEPNHPAGG